MGTIIFSQLFGEQEVARGVLKRESLSASWWGWLGSSLGGQNDKRLAPFKQEHLDAVQGQDLEFSLGVSYESAIGLATVFAEDDTAWLTAN
ncbi:hypothetical protein E4T42_06447 [Aureobasidium subglaciale]|nr:hypothetical protein E4T42_06447 [Aureobasidium subglaciale]